MLKISTVENRNHCCLVLEGRLVGPWAAEFRNSYEKAKVDFHDRELVIEAKNLTAISQEGENVVLELMKQGVKVRSSGMFMKSVFSQLARRMCEGDGQEMQR